MRGTKPTRSDAGAGVLAPQDGRLAGRHVRRRAAASDFQELPAAGEKLDGGEAGLQPVDRPAWDADVDCGSDL